jgi:DNA-binding transcriptional ArsR family regulator
MQPSSRPDGNGTTFDLEVTVDWAPPFELLASFGEFANHRVDKIHELGPSWSRDVRQRLTPELAVRIHPRALSTASGGHDTTRTRNRGEELLILLVHASPTRESACGFLDWLAEMSPGAAYELIAPLLPDDVHLPRDFGAWRDRSVDLLRLWDQQYFSSLDPGLLPALEREAAGLRRRLGTLPGVDLVEEVTNGLWVEPSAELRHVTLVPQHHQRPYNHDSACRGGYFVLYPADVLAAASDEPPLKLVRLTRGLAETSRLRILRFLANGPRSLTDVAQFAGLSQPTVHHHLAQLRAAGLVRVHLTASGPFRYSLRPRAVETFSKQLGDFLASSPGGSRT